jgi:hypothetical protein
MTTFTPWKVDHIGHGKPRWVDNVVKKWVYDRWNVVAVGWIIIKRLALYPHMDRDVFAQYSKKRLLKVKKTFIWVSNSPRKLSTGDKTKLLSSQRVGLDNGQPRVTWLGHFIVSFGMGTCWFQHVQLHLEE